MNLIQLLISALLSVHWSHAFPPLSRYHSMRRRTLHRGNEKVTSSLPGAINNDPDIELYNENGEEIQPGDMEFNELNLYGDDTESFNVDEGDTNNNADVKKLIECNASILLPFTAEVAFDAFSDLTRQPSWCKYLKSVEYIGFVNEETDENMSLRQSKWTVSVKGLRFSWTAKDTSISRPNRIEWESTSGMKNRGCVEFTPHAGSSNTQMKLSFTFLTPRVVSSLFRRSTIIRRYTEDVLLMGMLTDFRDVVMEEDVH